MEFDPGSYGYYLRVIPMQTQKIFAYMTGTVRIPNSGMQYESFWMIAEDVFERTSKSLICSMTTRGYAQSALTTRQASNTVTVLAMMPGPSLTNTMQLFSLPDVV